MSATQTMQRPDIVTLEMAGAIEEWKALPDGTIHILLRLPVRCTCCGTDHAWYINREGRTKCAECDSARGQTPKARTA
jgi:hypothetical protein